ncbi:MAG TPA: haloacid dehalogenase-like hydrolase [Chthoniobacterales bacterium]|jgi:2-hydroxy-3-keto-5-methylthiopentenyl-1-phosphate phosphatase|nr:haloacid dehalogenase-like hydrolase [Chthoniobacterales bacterium]
MANGSANTKRYLVASDFDQTLSFNDSGRVLAELTGIPGFDEKVAGLAKANLVQQGAELAYLLRHDPEFRSVRKEHLVEAGKHVRLKNNVDLLAEFFEKGLESYKFQFYVISASPQDVVQSALEGIVPPDHIFGTHVEYESSSGEISSIHRVSAGYGKIAVLQELETKLQTTPDHTIYMGDGSSDLFVMLHVNSREGYTIAVSEAKFLGRIAKRTVLSDSALSVMIPILEDILNWNSAQIRGLFESYGLALQEWDKTKTDRVSFQQYIRPISDKLPGGSRKTA